MLSVTTQGLREVGMLKNRLGREYGRGRINWANFMYLSEHLTAIEEKLLEMASNDPRRISEDERAS
jgi:hypothetical protein